jgi:hypothetical protein
MTIDTERLRELAAELGYWPAARPQGRGDDRRRYGDLRVRPDRPGPSGIERGLEIDDI